MRINAEEKIMYKVMKAIYDSGLPIDFKGSMVLKAYLIEAGYQEETRHTVDIDANWYSDKEISGENMTMSLQKIMNANNIGLNVSMYRMYGVGKSAGFKFVDKESGEILFSMDIDVNRPSTPVKVYEISGITFRGVTPLQMIADKTIVLSTDKIFRRVKDLVDLYYISNIMAFYKDEVMNIVMKSGREFGDFDAFLNRKDELIHSYNKFRFNGSVNKIDFDTLYEQVKSFISPIIDNK